MAGPGEHTDIKSYIETFDVGHFIKLYDGKTLPYENDSFDVVISNQFFEHIPYNEVSLRQVFRVLKPGGNFC